jgi:hypothetical protein
MADHGHKKEEYVPVKREKRGSRSQEGETCAREKEKPKITVTRKGNMYP